MIGRDFGRYRIVDRLGEGGMGSVWKAEDTLLHRSVALKFLAPELADSAEARQRFLREARAASVLDHPGIATVYDAGEIDGTPYLAVQMIEGPTISDRIRRGPLPVPEAVEIHRQASEALAHAHSRSVLHRDISSRNLMLKPDGSVVLVDFGLAKQSDMTQLTRTGTTQGTIAYLAPEVLEGAPATEASDRYSLGVVLYEMLTGDVPFKGERIEALMLKILTEEPEPPSSKRPEVTAEVDRAVLTLLRKDPGSRGVAPVARATGASAALGDLHIDAKPPTPGRAAPKRAIRTGASRRWLLIGIGALGLLVLTATLLWMKPWQKPVGRTLPAGTFRSIAVLPLENASQNAEESDFLAEGIANLITTKLTGLSGLTVTPWVTSKRFSDLSRLRDSGKTLNVEVLLAGTFRQHDERIQLSVELIDVASGAQIWASVFEEPTGGFFEVQRRIATNVATELLGEVPSSEEEALQKVPTQNPDAYSRYLQGAWEVQEGTREASGRALEHFVDALAGDSTLVEAHIGIGAVFTSRYFFGWEGGAENMDLAEQHFTDALRLDPGSISALRGLERVGNSRGDTRGQHYLRRIMEAMDTSRVEVRLGIAEAWTMGLWPEKALPFLESVLIDDPANLEAAWFRVLALAFAGRYKECVMAGDAFEALHGEDAEVLTWRGYSYLYQGQLDRARQDTERAIDLFADSPNPYVYGIAWAVYEVSGEPALARGCLAQIEEMSRPIATLHPDQWIVVLNFAWARALGGDRGPLDQLVESTFVSRVWTPRDPSSIDWFLLAYWRLGDRQKCRDILDSCLADDQWFVSLQGGLVGTLYPKLLTDPILAPKLRALLARREKLL